MNSRTRLFVLAISLASFTQVFGQPVIIQQPQNQTNLVGSTATFQVKNKKGSEVTIDVFCQ